MRVPSVSSIAVLVYVVCNFYIEHAISEEVYCKCPPPPPPPFPGGCPGKPPCKQDNLFGISNTITTKIVKRIIDTRDRNNKYQSFAISVFNILNALLLITNGACKETLKQLLTYESICDLSKINNQFRNYRPQLQRNVTVGKDQKALIRTFAGLFPADGLKLRPGYVSKMHRDYGASVQTVQYATNGQKALNTINYAISNATFGFYPKFFPFEFDPTTRAVLVCTLYLRISWEPEYFYQTSTANFYQMGAGSIARVPFLSNKQGVSAAAYAEIDNIIFVQLPTYLAQFTFIAFYPQDRNEDPALYLRTLTSAKIVRIFKALENVAACQVNVTIPQFSVRSSYSNLDSILKAGGVTDLFKKANLCKAVKPSPKSNDLYVSEIVHDAAVTVDKYGLTAVAATAIVVGVTAAQICEQQLKQFYANHPFCYFVADKDNKAVLFTGCIYNVG